MPKGIQNKKKSGVMSLAARFEQQDSSPAPPSANSSYKGRSRQASISQKPKASDIFNRASSFAEQKTESTASNITNSSNGTAKRIVIPKSFSGEQDAEAPVKPSFNPAHLRKTSASSSWFRATTAEQLAQSAPPKADADPTPEQEVDTTTTTTNTTTNDIKDDASPASDVVVESTDAESLLSEKLNHDESTPFSAAHTLLASHPEPEAETNDALNESSEETVSPTSKY